MDAQSSTAQNPTAPSTQPTPTLRWPTAGELLRLRCPICWGAPMFRHPLAMNASCTACGHTYDRGNGYFLGAMFISYGIVVILIGLLVGAMILAGVAWKTILLVAAACVPVVGPLFAFPVSRVLWVMGERRLLRWGEDDDDALRAELARRRAARDRS